MCQIVLNPKNECFVKQPVPWWKFLFCDFPVVGLGQTLPSSICAEAPLWAHLTVLLIIDESAEKNGSDNLAFVSWSWSGWSNVSSEINNLYQPLIYSSPYLEVLQLTFFYTRYRFLFCFHHLGPAFFESFFGICPHKKLSPINCTFHVVLCKKKFTPRWSLEGAKSFFKKSYF